MKNMLRRMVPLVLAVWMLLSLCGCRQESKSLPKLEEMNDSGITLGVMTGSSYDTIAKEQFPLCQRSYYRQMPDEYIALEQGKIDAMFIDYPYYISAQWEGVDLQLLEGSAQQFSTAFIFPKGGGSAALRGQINDFVQQAWEDGTIQRLQEKWLSESEPTEHPDFTELTGGNGRLKAAMAPDLKPMSYLKGSSITGYEVELLQEFCKAAGYSVEFEICSFDALLPGVIGGRYDMAIGGFNITPERQESLDFSEPHLYVDVMLAVAGENMGQTEGSWWERLQESFAKTFIREDRWKLIAGGLGITVLISICAVLGGTVIGLGLYLLSRSANRRLSAVVQGVAKVYGRIIAGTPTVVILMILFYVVFGSVRDISGVLVAIIGFSLTFGSFVYSSLTVAVGSVDRGQTEAAYALGYTRNRAFFRVVLPQAMAVFLPSYSGEAVSLVKGTAVVGYIAVNDLTKVGDIIRSNTYEAFFPLIATAVIYFLLTWVITLLLQPLCHHFEPKRRSRKKILKNIKTQ